MDRHEPFKTLNVRKRGKLTANITEVATICGEIKISAKKKRDLLDVLPMINPCFHAFYENLASDEIPDIHPDLVEEENDGTDDICS